MGLSNKTYVPLLPWRVSHNTQYLYTFVVVYVSGASTYEWIALTCEVQDIAVAWEALFAYDSLVIVLTILKTYKARPRHDFVLTGPTNIVSLVLRDGVCISTCNTAESESLNLQVLSITRAWFSACRWTYLTSIAAASWLWQTLPTFSHFMYVLCASEIYAFAKWPPTVCKRMFCQHGCVPEY